ncbi:MAG: hypothetical protein R3Y24_14405 [Eubacteriales bacterium]
MQDLGMDIIPFQEEGYKPLVDFESWRVAVLKFCDDLRIENVKTMQKHNETDEVFVLLQGSCTLFLAGMEEKPSTITAVKMEPHKIYNIKKGVWHNHIMDEGSEVLIVENQNTCDDNSPIVPLTKEQLVELNAL